MLFWSICRVYTGRCGKAGAGIWRTTGREVMRSISESAGVRRMSGVEDNEIFRRQYEGVPPRKKKIFPVAIRLGETPVPIPNTMVKPQPADGTMLETAWESRRLPESKGLIAQPVRAHA